MKTYKLSTLSLSCAALLLVSACQSATTSGMTDDRSLRTSKIDAALDRASSRDVTSGTLSSLERQYKRNPEDEINAATFAAALRRSGQPEQAATILAPFAKDKTASAASKSEYAAIQLALGNFESAEEYAQTAILQDTGYYKAYQNLGIALDAQNQPEKAERAYRKGLELWQGDPTSIMNNLALNLTAQDYLDEAAEILQKAKALSPEKEEIERNLRIVSALQQSNGAPAPKPPSKPDI